MTAATSSRGAAFGGVGFFQVVHALCCNADLDSYYRFPSRPESLVCSEIGNAGTFLLSPLRVRDKAGVQRTNA